MAHRYHRDYCRLLSVSNSDSVANGYSVDADSHTNGHSVDTDTDSNCHTAHTYSDSDGHSDDTYSDSGDTDTESDGYSRNTDADTVAKRESHGIAVSHTTAHSDHQPVDAHARSHR